MTNQIVRQIKKYKIEIYLKIFYEPGVSTYRITSIKRPGRLKEGAFNRSNTVFAQTFCTFLQYFKGMTKPNKKYHVYTLLSDLLLDGHHNKPLKLFV